MKVNQIWDSIPGAKVNGDQERKRYCTGTFYSSKDRAKRLHGRVIQEKLLLAA
jgi:hypothetical protein